MDEPIKPFVWTDNLEFMRQVDEIAFYSFGNRVLSGPFLGMQIPKAPVWEDGNTSAKLFGTYEHELHPCIQAAIARQPRTIVNIGCAEGYYAIGLAQLLPEATVHAFDINPEALAQCAEYAVKNGVDARMRFHVGCKTPEKLIIEGEEPFLYVMDCEGYELDLIDFEKCPQLARADLIIECHNFMFKNTSETLATRCTPTHNVSLLRPEDLPPAYPVIEGWPVFLRILLVISKRPPDFKWLVGWAK